MLIYILFGIGFMLLIEGFFYFFFTKQMIEMIKQIEVIEVEKIKSIAAFSIVVGIGIIYFTIKYFS